MNCYICGSTVPPPHATVNGHILHKCDHCQFIWVTSLITEEQLQSFYTEKYFHSNTNIGYANYIADEKNLRLNASDLLATLFKIKNLQKNARILDVGCACGFLLDEAKAKFFANPYGVEMSGFAYEYATKNLCLENIYQKLSDIALEAESFDCALLIGTIEHLINPRSIAQQIFNLLNKGGILAITTIDTKGWLPLYALKPPEHLVYFSHENLARMLRDVGFVVTYRKTYFVRYQVNDLLHRLKEFRGWRLFDLIKGLLPSVLLNLNIRIPTNEMLIIAEKA